MVFQIRKSDGSLDPFSSGTWIAQNGQTRHLSISDFEIQALGAWKSPHSGATYPARWSVTDLAEAHWIGCSYVITSVEKGKATLTNSFLLNGTLEEDKRFEDEEVRVEVTSLVK
jgi:hypothetical protein